MKVIIAGSRKILNPISAFEAVKASGFTLTGVISGGAQGVDTIAIYYAGYMRLPFPDIYYAKWGSGANRDMGAGHKRNALMAEKGDALVAVWDGRSGGTKNMIETMKALGKPVYVHLYEYKDNA